MPAIVYYNEIDKYCCKWLENLMEADFLPYGYIDDRPIQELKPHDLEPYTQCHFFAGIGGWPLALRMAGWPDDWPVWTGSCPCQPFSVAGKRKGTADERHLWPYFHKLIGECNPTTIFGEQVVSKDGRKWLSGVQTDLEALGYAFGGADLCAAGVGAPHIRQRLYWLAESECWTTKRQRFNLAGTSQNFEEEAQQREWVRNDIRTSEFFGGMVNNNNKGLEGRGISTECSDQCFIEPSGVASGLVEPTGEQVGFSRQPWEHFDVVHCLDGKTRRIEPGTFPLAHGIPARMGKLRAYGNAIVAPLAAEFIKAYLATLSQS